MSTHKFNRATGINRKRRRGQAIVELALMMPFAILMLFAVLEYSFVVKNSSTTSYAAREGARYGSVGKTVEEIRGRVAQEAWPLSVAATNAVTIQYSEDHGTTWYTLGNSGTKNSAPVGALIRVTVVTQHTSFTGKLIPLLNRPLTGKVTMRREAV